MANNNENPENKVKISFTNVFVRDLDNKKLLLGFKKRGLGVNKWNGLGGKQQDGENLVQCAKRFNIYLTKYR